MKKWAKRIGIAFAALILLLVGLAVYGFYSMQQNEVLDGELTGNNVSAPVKLVRDENHIVHVISKNETDLYYGLGYAMAQDRFTQMDTLRHLSEGRLSEWTGALPISDKTNAIAVMDTFMRALEFETHAKAGLENMDMEHRTLLAAFTKGVNAYLEDVKDDPPFEYKLMRWKLEPWREHDSLAIPYIYGMVLLEINFYTEWMLEELTAKYDRKFALEFLTLYPNDGPIITAANRQKALFSPGESINREFTKILRNFSGFGMYGSNSWVVAGSRTKSGKPLLANDPHVPLNIAPTLWYHVHLKGGRYDVQGMMFPGFPVFGVGSNRNISWGLTNIMADQVDLFRVKINPKDPNQYEYDGKFEKFRILEGEIDVRGSDPHKFRIRVSKHGPLIDEGMMGNWVERKNKNEALAIKTPDGLEMGRFTGSYMDLGLARNWAEYTDALKGMSNGPVGWNQIYADTNGNIGYWATVKLPIRQDNQGSIVRDGTNPDADWKGYVPFEELPHSYNPPKGFIVTANNRLAGNDYPYYISSDYDPPYRASRITEMITSAKKPLTTDDFVKFQKDVQVVPAREIVPVVLDVMEPDTKNDKTVQVVGWVQLMEWKLSGYSSTVDSPGAAIYNVFISTLIEEFFSDELGDDADLVINSPAGEKKLYEVFADPNNHFWDDVSTKSNIEKRSDIIERSFEKTVFTLEKTLGSDATKWKWGDLNKLWIGHPFGIVPIFGKPFSIGVYPYPGNGITVNMGYGIKVDDRYFVVMGPSSRFIVDMANTSSALFNSSSGMSGNPFAERFDNITPKWLNHEYLTLELDENKFTANSKAVLTLTK